MSVNTAAKFISLQMFLEVIRAFIALVLQKGKDEKPANFIQDEYYFDLEN